jgi:hypothetical protein
MCAWDKVLEHSNLPVEDVPTANIRRKRLYPQMTITMNRGLMMGKGVHIQHPKRVIKGIHIIFPE